MKINKKPENNLFLFSRNAKSFQEQLQKGSLEYRRGFALLYLILFFKNRKNGRPG